MRSSTYVEEIDMKKATLCAGCAGMLKQQESKETTAG